LRFYFCLIKVIRPSLKLIRMQGFVHYFTKLCDPCGNRMQEETKKNETKGEL